jgi:hypothetical protein
MTAMIIADLFRLATPRLARSMRTCVERISKLEARAFRPWQPWADADGLHEF